MKKFLKTLALTVSMTFAGSAMAQTIDLSATDFSKSAVTLNLAAGDYSVSLVSGLYTAWAAKGTYDANTNTYDPTGNWADYYDYTVNGVTTRVNPFLPSYPRFTTAFDAFNAYSAAGPLTLSFAAPTAVTFAIADTQASFGDNNGGLSLNVAAVPEPATWGLMILGLGMVGYAMRRSARRSQQGFASEGAIA